MVEYDAVVLAGGAAKRLGGADKPGLDFGGRTALDRVLDAVEGAEHTVVVGPARTTDRCVTWVRENPPGAGPVAALRHGLAYATADRVVVLAADVPLVDRGTVERLVAAAEGHDGAVLCDGRHEQFLLAVYDHDRLAANVAPLPASASLRRAVTGLDLVKVTDDNGASLDCDTWDQVEQVRQRL
ncbi:molybdenum cofactor guanylyltransferase [Vallicoccus soli]|uniref:Molybdenum cofactor guanylyltransferase n=2 Tax=Vallicoccus soli TaxID=2339232 RepID=A0A3A3ZN99_9ACTN|nr:molybdenum cofactor guanylyltransferase [Vallicoccus soli]